MKLIRHKWNDVIPTKLLKHKKCERCNCEKYYSLPFGQVMYEDRFGKLWFRAPECVLPNTKLK